MMPLPSDRTAPVRSGALDPGAPQRAYPANAARSAEVNGSPGDGDRLARLTPISSAAQALSFDRRSTVATLTQRSTIMAIRLVGSERARGSLTARTQGVPWRSSGPRA